VNVSSREAFNNDGSGNVSIVEIPRLNPICYGSQNRTVKLLLPNSNVLQLKVECKESFKVPVRKAVIIVDKVCLSSHKAVTGKSLRKNAHANLGFALQSRS
jgi:hypothetical protein